MEPLPDDMYCCGKGENTTRIPYLWAGENMEKKANTTWGNKERMGQTEE